MWHRFAFGPGGQPFFGRGDMKFAILDLLKDKSKHGYEIMKDLEARGSGFYAPSAGSVYPTLQMLEDMGYVVSRTEEGKKVYEITNEGKKYLEENRKTINDIHERFGRQFEHGRRPEMRETMREVRDLVGTLFQAARAGKLQNTEKMEEVRSVLNRTRKEIEEIINK